jgi:IS30 family transposase
MNLGVMKKTRKVLSLEDRQSIWTMKAAGIGIREIGRRIKKAASIVSRELRSNALPIRVSLGLTPLERAKAAHDKAKERRRSKRRGKRKALPRKQVYEHIASKLSEKWSPETISSTWGEFFSGEKISTSTIYRMIKWDWPELKKYLPERGKKRRAQVMNRRGKVQQAAAEKRHISERSVAANRRQEIGHLEVDSILSKRGSKAAIVSIIDRKTRRRWYIFVRNLEAETVRKALVAFLHTLKDWQRKSLTMDRGSEFAEWKMLEKIFPSLKIYFCTAYSPHEKGSVERSNRDFRRFFPKGTDFFLVSQEEIDQAQMLINNKPMKCLLWKSPAQLDAQATTQSYKKAA